MRKQYPFYSMIFNNQQDKQKIKGILKRICVFPCAVLLANLCACSSVMDDFKQDMLEQLKWIRNNHAEGEEYDPKSADANLDTLEGEVKNEDDTNPVVLQVGKDAIHAREYADAVANMVATMDSSFGMEMDWTDDETIQMAQLFMDGEPMSMGRNMVIETHVITQKAAELGMLTAKELDRMYAESRAQTVSAHGGEEPFQQSLRESGLTESLYKYWMHAQFQLDALEEYYFGENGIETVDEREIEQYFNDQYLAAKYILILTHHPWSGEQKRTSEQALREAQNIYARLDKGENFDALMNELSEDSSFVVYPDSDVFTEGEMDDAFYESTKALELGEYSAPVPSSDGYYIIQRQPLDPATQLEDHRDVIKDKLGYTIGQKLNQWIEETTIIETDALSLITYANLYDYTSFERQPVE